VPDSFSPLDFKSALRRLVRERGFTATVLLTLALCIGANVAIFAVVDAVLVRALPFPEPERLVNVINSYPKAGVERAGASLPNYFERKDALKAFASVAIHQGGSAIIGESGSPRRVQRDRVSPEFFATLGVPLAQGRTFTAEEMVSTGTGSVAVLTDEFWRSQFQADPAVLGKTFIMNGVPATVVGVLPPGFRFLSSRAQFFTPVTYNADDRKADRRHSNNYQFIARLAPGVSAEAAQAQMDAFNQQQLADDPYAELVKGVGFTTMVRLLHADHVRTIRPALLLLQGGVLFLLLIGAVNLINLLLIRAGGRAKEYAVRQALGASRRHVVSDVLAETVLLALAGGLLGLAFGAAGIKLLGVLGTDQLPLGATVALDLRVALVALAGSLITGLLLALPIVWFNLHAHLAPVLQAETRGGTASRSVQRLRHVFIITQVALAFVLLSGAGLLGVSLRHVLSASPGFRPESVLTGRVSLPYKRYPETKERLPFYERLLAEVRAQPGVVAAGLISNLPMTGETSNNAIAIEGLAPGPNDAIRAHYTSGVIGDYMTALGIPLVEGRFLEEADNHRDQKVCVVDEDFAKRYWPGQSALGRRIVNGPVFKAEEAHTIVGVVGNVKQTDLADRNAQGAVYYPYPSYNSSSLSLVVRTATSTDALAPVLPKLVLKLDPDLPVDDLKPMQGWIDNTLVARRSPAVLAALFAAVALLLAAVGTYGVLAYAVNQRRREIGVRMALGALPSQVQGQFLGLGAKLLVAGLGLGVAGAWAAGQAMRSLLFDVAAMDVGVLVVTGLVLMAVVLLAAFLPSHRAARVSPVEALRGD
jgi:predicted permease